VTRRRPVPVSLRVAGLALALLAPAAARAQAGRLEYERTLSVDAKEKPLRGPEGVGCTDGTVVVADTSNGRLVLYRAKAGALEPGPEVRLAQLTAPRRVHVDRKGNVLALDGRTRRIVRVGPEGAFAGIVGYEGAPAPAAVVPVAFDLDAADHVFVLDAAGREVLEVDGDRVVRRIALPKAPRAAFTDVAVDAAGTVHVVEAVEAVLWSAAKGAAAFTARSKPLKEHMSFPGAIAAAKGKLYLVDRAGAGVVTLGTDGSYQGRQLGLGATPGLVAYPGQLCVTPGGRAYLADAANDRVQVFGIGR
jgi:DNA-binding beta-propeller fold protein YncE